MISKKVVHSCHCFIVVLLKGAISTGAIGGEVIRAVFLNHDNFKKHEIHVRVPMDALIKS